MKKKKVRSGIIRLLREAGGYKLLLFALLANIGEGIGNAFAAASGGKMLDAFTALDGDSAIHYLIQVILYAILLTVSIICKDSLLGSYQEQGMVKLRKKTISILGITEMEWLDKHHSGELSSRVTGDLNALGNALRPVLIMGLSVTVSQLIIVTYMFYANWILTLIIIAIVPVTTFLQWIGSRPVKKYQSANRDAAGQISTVVADCRSAFETVKSLQLENEMKKRFHEASEKQFDADIKTNRIAAFLAPLSLLGRYLPQLILILIGGIFVINQAITIGQLTVFLGLSYSALHVFDNLFTLITSIRQLTVNAERVTALWDSPVEHTGKSDSVFSEYCTGTTAENNDLVEFENVSFSYHENQNILSDISLSVKSGEFVALVGESGCGKSTLLKLACSLYKPTSGKITILGRDMKNWNPDELRSYISCVTQDTWLFHGSIRENVICENITCKDISSIQNIYHIAGLTEYIQNHPEGDSVLVGERGAFLSGGQRQRISVARALYKKAKILILDEATSALDQSMESQILEEILAMENRPAIIMITHHLSNAAKADQIYVMQEGRICENGAHQELAGTGGIYDMLLARQKEEVVF